MKQSFRYPAVILFFFFLVSFFSNLIDALNKYDGGVRQILGPKGTAGIWATYPQDYLSIGNGFGDQVNKGK